MPFRFFTTLSLSLIFWLAPRALAEAQRYDVVLFLGNDGGETGELTRTKDETGERFSLTVNGRAYPLTIDAAAFSKLDQIAKEELGDLRVATEVVRGGFKNGTVKQLVLRLDPKSATTHSIKRTGAGKIVVKEVAVKLTYAHRAPGATATTIHESEVALEKLRAPFAIDNPKIAVQFGKQLVPVIDLTAKPEGKSKSTERIVVGLDDTFRAASFGADGIRAYRVHAGSFLYYDETPRDRAGRESLLPLSQRVEGAKAHQVGTLWVPTGPALRDFRNLVFLAQAQVAETAMGEEFDAALESLRGTQTRAEYLETLYRVSREVEPTSPTQALIPSMSHASTRSRLVEKTMGRFFEGAPPTIEELTKLLGRDGKGLEPVLVSSLKLKAFEKPGAVRSEKDYVALAALGGARDNFVHATFPLFEKKLNLDALEFSDLVTLAQNAAFADRDQLKKIVLAAKKKVTTGSGYEGLTLALLDRLRKDPELEIWFVKETLAAYLAQNPSNGDIARFVAPRFNRDPIYFLEEESLAAAYRLTLTTATTPSNFNDRLSSLVSQVTNTKNQETSERLRQVVTDSLDAFFALKPSPHEVNWLSNLAISVGLSREQKDEFWKKAIRTLQQPADYWALELPGRFNRGKSVTMAMWSFRQEFPETFATPGAWCRIAIRKMLGK